MVSGFCSAKLVYIRLHAGGTSGMHVTVSFLGYANKCYNNDKTCMFTFSWLTEQCVALSLRRACCLFSSASWLTVTTDTEPPTAGADGRWTAVPLTAARCPFIPPPPLTARGGDFPRIAPWPGRAFSNCGPSEERKAAASLSLCRRSWTSLDDSPE